MDEFRMVPLFPDEAAWLTGLCPGDPVVRWLAGAIPMPLVVTRVRRGLITCGHWKFNRETGGEVDEDLGWDGKGVTGSYIRPPAQ